MVQFEKAGYHLIVTSTLGVDTQFSVEELNLSDVTFSATEIRAMLRGNVRARRKNHPIIGTAANETTNGERG